VLSVARIAGRTVDWKKTSTISRTTGNRGTEITTVTSSVVEERGVIADPDGVSPELG